MDCHLQVFNFPATPRDLSSLYISNRLISDINVIELKFHRGHRISLALPDNGHLLKRNSTTGLNQSQKKE